MAIQSTAILSADTTIFTCPGLATTDAREYAVTCIIFCNSAEIDITLTVHYVPANEPKSFRNMVVNGLTIPAGETFTFDTEKIILSTGDRVQAIASVGPDDIGKGVNAIISTLRVS